MTNAHTHQHTQTHSRTHPFARLPTYTRKRLCLHNARAHQQRTGQRQRTNHAHSAHPAGKVIQQLAEARTDKETHTRTHSALGSDYTWPETISEHISSPGCSGMATFMTSDGVRGHERLSMLAQGPLGCGRAVCGAQVCRCGSLLVAGMWECDRPGMRAHT